MNCTIKSELNIACCLGVIPYTSLKKDMLGFKHIPIFTTFSFSGGCFSEVQYSQQMLAWLVSLCSTLGLYIKHTHRMLMLKTIIQRYVFKNSYNAKTNLTFKKQTGFYSTY